MGSTTGSALTAGDGKVLLPTTLGHSPEPDPQPLFPPPQQEFRLSCLVGGGSGGSGAQL